MKTQAVDWPSNEDEDEDEDLESDGLFYRSGAPVAVALDDDDSEDGEG